jgi:hypothetical protein
MKSNYKMSIHTILDKILDEIKSFIIGLYNSFIKNLFLILFIIKKIFLL